MKTKGMMNKALGTMPSGIESRIRLLYYSIKRGIPRPLRPWMTPAEIRLIESYLGDGHIMLEWGSGGTTVRFSRKVMSYCSIEHDPEWYRRVASAIRRKRLSNVQIELAEVDVPENGQSPLVHTPEGRLAMSSQERSDHFSRYINAVDRFGYDRFDRVLVDGRARPECLLKVSKYIDDQSIVFVHDYYASYHTVEYKKYFHGLVGDHYNVINSADSLVALRIR